MRRSVSPPIQPEEIERSIPERFKEQVERAPDAVAVRTRTRQLSYARLDSWSNAIAADLLDRLDAAPEPVPFLLPQGPLAIAATIGILKAGKFYVPLDPSWGAQRTTDLVGELHARAFLTDAEFSQAFRNCIAAAIVELSPEPPAVDVPPVQMKTVADQPAYIYFTSGSTGRPKGVVDCHRNVLHNVMRYTRALNIAHADHLSLLQSCGFSGTVSSMFGALLNGATSCPIDMRAETPARVAQWLDDLSVTIYHSVPSLFRSVASAGQVFHHVRVVRLEGDRATRLDLELFRRHFMERSVLAVGLGTTETGLVCQYFFDHNSALPEGVVPIGYPVTDMQFEVRGDDAQPAQPGTAGEIVVRSRFLAGGYWNDAAATARAFESAGPGSLERLYKTGDRGRIDDLGRLEYLGRVDGRARVRGQWVELAEVDAALGALPGVREAAVAAVGTDDSNTRLAAYYVAESHAQLGTSSLRRQLARRLPAHMVPSRFIELEQLPLNANGKIDRAALPKPQSARPNLGPVVEPVSLAQLRLCELWEELLGVAPVGTHDDFFDLGGDSLLAVVMIDRTEAIFERRIAVAGLLGEGDVTIERVAALALTDSRDMEAPVVSIRTGNGRPPLFFLHGDYFSGGIYCRELVRYLHMDQPFLTLAPGGFDGGSIPSSYEAMAEQHLRTIRDIQPHGPYILGGECNGGLVAYEIARLLEAQGEQVGLLMLLSASAQNVRFAWLSTWLRIVGSVLGISPSKQRHIFRRFTEFALDRGLVSKRALLGELLRKSPRLATKFRKLATMLDADPSSFEPGAHYPDNSRENRRQRLRAAYQQLDRGYLPGRFGGRVTLIRGREETPATATEREWWRTVAADVEAIEVPGDNRTKLTRYVSALAHVIDRLLDEALSESRVETD
jgi:amino acid adenylation domain-containing protein